MGAGKLDDHASIWPVLGALTANTVSKIVAAALTGGARFALPVGIGLALSTGASWVVACLQRTAA